MASPLPIEVEICVGTACHVMGGSDLMLLPKVLDERGLSQVQVKGARCLGYCRDQGHDQAPYVHINGKLITRATVESVIDEILRLVKEAADES